MMTLENKNLPDFYQVKLGISTFELDAETLIASMAHQFISKSTNLENVYNYDILYQMCKDEIQEYLIENKDELNTIDLFGDWIDNFKLYHGKKNEPICRDIVFSFSDNSKYSIKILDLISLKNDDGIDFINYEDPLLTDDNALMEFVQSLKWEEIKDYAEELQRPQPEPDYEAEWASCDKEIIKWEDSFGILDFLESCDILELEDAPDDQPT